MSVQSITSENKQTHVRYIILLIIFIITAVNYADRVTLSIAGTEVSKSLGLDVVDLGKIFSAFGISYLLMQLPGGWLLDRFGTIKVYTYSLVFWSFFTLLQGFVGWFPVAYAVMSLFLLQFLLGFAEAPAFPANARMVAAWFPAKERATASSIFNAAQYFSLAIFSPFLGWLTYAWGWQNVFVVMGVIGFVLTIFWVKFVRNPLDHPGVSASELKYIEQGGAVVNMDQDRSKAGRKGPKWDYVRQLLSSRMMLGIFFGQYFLNTITWFFLTWFPIYLVQEKGMSILKVGLIASIPAMCGFCGGILGGVVSDHLLKRGFSLTAARKIPIVCGMILASGIILCNYTNNNVLVVALMALAFFGKGFGALGWPVIADTAPKEMVGMCGAIFNIFGNVASIVTPLLIGYLVKGLHSFNSALIFVGCSALMSMLCYLLVVGEIKRLEFKKN
ncbi:MAG: MFS transporter [Rouxiella aceris]|uniref:MFS transporter n=1 Tax=Rouxiella aceris TaxID=2703884 RepID=UPI00284C6F0B|nr:MFS transporter [Rouxiella aceris]MDR3433228.1 MFS transporter [Rouxiella aceris]